MSVIFGKMEDKEECIMAERLVAPNYWNNLIAIFFGYEKCAPGYSFGPGSREYYLVHYILSGKGIYSRGNNTYKVNTGDLFIIRPDEETFYCADRQNPWEYAWLAFRIPDPPMFLDEPVIRQPPIGHIFTFIRDHFRDKSIDGKIYSLTYELLWILTQKESSRMPEDYALYAKTYFELSYARPITIQNIAVNLHIDRRYLTEVFRKTYGISPKAYLTNLRMEKAIHYMDTGHNITESARMAGFTDLSNFYKQYKDRYGSLPGVRLKKL